VTVKIIYFTFRDKWFLFLKLRSVHSVGAHVQNLFLNNYGSE